MTRAPDAGAGHQYQPRARAAVTKEVTSMHADQGDAMDLRARAQQYTGPSAGRIASLIPHAAGFEQGWFRTTTAICHGGDERDGLAFRQRADGNGIDVRCHSGDCTRGQIVTALEGLIGLPIWTLRAPHATDPRAPRRRWRSADARSRQRRCCWRRRCCSATGWKQPSRTRAPSASRAFCSPASPAGRGGRSGPDDPGLRPTTSTRPWGRLSGGGPTSLPPGGTDHERPRQQPQGGHS